MLTVIAAGGTPVIEYTVSVLVVLAGSGTHDPVQSVTMYMVVELERCSAGCNENVFGSGVFWTRWTVAAPATSSDLFRTQ